MAPTNNIMMAIDMAITGLLMNILPFIVVYVVYVCGSCLLDFLPSLDHTSSFGYDFIAGGEAIGYNEFGTALLA